MQNYFNRESWCACNTMLSGQLGYEVSIPISVKTQRPCQGCRQESQDNRWNTAGSHTWLRFGCIRTAGWRGTGTLAIPKRPRTGWPSVTTNNGDRYQRAKRNHHSDAIVSPCQSNSGRLRHHGVRTNTSYRGIAVQVGALAPWRLDASTPERLNASGGHVLLATHSASHCELSQRQQCEGLSPITWHVSSWTCVRWFGTYKYSRTGTCDVQTRFTGSCSRGLAPHSTSSHSTSDELRTWSSVSLDPRGGHTRYWQSLWPSCHLVWP